MNPLSPKILLRIEGAVILFLPCYLYHTVGGSWAMFAVLFLAPDIFMVGYLQLASERVRGCTISATITSFPFSSGQSGILNR